MQAIKITKNNRKITLLETLQPLYSAFFISPEQEQEIQFEKCCAES